MAALVAHAQTPMAAYDVVLVVSNRPDAPGLEHARTHGIATAITDHRPFGQDRQAHERVLDAVLHEHGIEVVALAGYMRVLTPWLVERWQGRMLNIHPSLLPKYPGLNTHARALAADDPEAGCSVHLVTSGMDEGPVLNRAHVPILAGDTVSTLSERVLLEEHRLYPPTLDAFCRALD